MTAPKSESEDAYISQWRSSLHFQGAVAVEGEALIWKPASKQSLWDSTSSSARMPDQITDNDQHHRKEPPVPPFDQGPLQQQPVGSPGATAAAANADPGTAQHDSSAARGDASSAGSAADDVSRQPVTQMQAGQSRDGATQRAQQGNPVISAESQGEVVIPYDWEVSIGEDGKGVVEGTGGSIAVGQVSKGDKTSSGTAVFPKAVHAGAANAVSRGKLATKDSAAGSKQNGKRCLDA